MVDMFGPTEVQWYQLTPEGAQRVQAGQVQHLDSATRQALFEIVKLGGKAEWDELKMFGTMDSPTVLSTALKRLTDLGYIEPVVATSEGV